MTPMTLSSIARAVNGRLVGDDLVVESLVTDTRRLDATSATSALFVAIKGENFDGNDYVARAAELGARAALVSRETAGLVIPQVVVANTELALAQLATAMQRERRSPAATARPASRR